MNSDPRVEKKKWRWEEWDDRLDKMTTKTLRILCEVNHVQGQFQNNKETPKLSLAGLM